MDPIPSVRTMFIVFGSTHRIPCDCVHNQTASVTGTAAMMRDGNDLDIRTERLAVLEMEETNDVPSRSEQTHQISSPTAAMELSCPFAPSRAQARPSHAFDA